MTEAVWELTGECWRLHAPVSGYRPKPNFLTCMGTARLTARFPIGPSLLTKTWPVQPFARGINYMGVGNAQPNLSSDRGHIWASGRTPILKCFHML